MITFAKLRLMGSDDEQGTVRLMWIMRRLSIDVYTWPRVRWNAWMMPSVGVLGNLRLGRIECQIRWR